MPEATTPATPVTITLELEHRDAELWGVLTFAASAPYELERYNVQAVGADYFNVLEGDDRLPYLGRCKKVDGEKLVKLSPDEPVTREVRLDGRYPFASGRHSYTVQYRALHLPPAEDADFVQLRSNVVEVEHEA